MNFMSECRFVIIVRSVVKVCGLKKKDQKQTVYRKQAEAESKAHARLKKHKS